MDSIITTDILNWQDFVDEFENYLESDKYIFRGQSNSVKKVSPYMRDGNVVSAEPIEWELISSFNQKNSSKLCFGVVG